MKTVLIGASGFLGRHVLQALSADGHECEVLTRQPSRRRELQLIPGVCVRRADVFDVAELVARLEGADAVVSMAGILNERGRRGHGFRRVHVDLVAGLIEACERAGVGRILHVSALNAGRGESHYLQSKGEAERLLLASETGVTLFQPSVIFGPGDSFFNRFAGLLRLAPVLPLACPDSRLQPVYVRDVARVMAASLADDSTTGQTFELGGPRVYTLQELVQWTARQMGWKRWVPGLPDALSRMQGLVMDFVPGKPFSSDNYLSLQLDNVVTRDAFPSFGIQPASVEAIVPGYLGTSPHQQHLDALRRGARRT